VLPALNRHTRVDNRLTRLDPLGLMCACMNKSSDADIKQEGGFRPQANYSKKTECTGKFFDKRPKTVYRVDTRQRQRLDLDDLPDSAWTEMPRNTPGRALECGGSVGHVRNGIAWYGGRASCADTRRRAVSSRRFTVWSTPHRQAIALMYSS
jgi:hypothetical protein